MNYHNRRKAQVKNRDTGYTNKLFVAPKDWFTTLEEPVGPFTTPGASEKIVDDHTFATGKGFMELYTTQDSVDAPAETAGEVGSKKLVYSPVGFVPGDGPEVQGLIKDLLNDDLILVLDDANCPDGPKVQFGCDCNPARIETVAFTSGTTATDGRKGHLITFNSKCRWFYEGTVTMLPDTP